MVETGKQNLMKVIKSLDFGIYLDGGELGEILMPAKWVPENTVVGDELEAFVYYDSEDRPIATTLKPKAQAGEFAWLKVKDTNKLGAFLDWGLEKDLLVPFGEQKAKMQKGYSYLVYVMVDPRSKRMMASSKLEKFLNAQPADYEEGQQVDLIIWTKTELGYWAIVNQKHLGLLYANEVFRDLAPGMTTTGYISKIRPDGKIDLRLEKPGYEKIDELSGKILRAIQDQNGFLNLHDKSPAELIYSTLGMSKKNFKKSIGSLYKDEIIAIEKDGIRLL